MESNSAKRLDSVLTSLKPWGKWQIRILFVQLLLCFPASFQMLSILFTATYPDFSCRVSKYGMPFGDSNTSSSFQSSTTNSLAVNLTVHSLISDSQCDVYNVSSGSITPCKQGYVYSTPRHHSIISDWDLVCSSEYLVGLSQTMFTMGQGIGTTISMYLADRFGRKNICLINLCLTGVAGVAMSFSPSITVFIILRFIAGLFQAGFALVVSVIILEIVPVKERTYLALIGNLSWAVGMVSYSGIGYLCRNLSWRNKQLAFTTPCLFIVLNILFLDESVRWLLANGKYKVIQRIIKKAARINGKETDKTVKCFIDWCSRKDIGTLGGERLLDTLTDKSISSYSKQGSHGSPVFEQTANEHPLVTQYSSNFALGGGLPVSSDLVVRSCKNRDFSLYTSRRDEENQSDVVDELLSNGENSKTRAIGKNQVVEGEFKAQVVDEADRKHNDVYEQDLKTQPVSETCSNPLLKKQNSAGQQVNEPSNYDQNATISNPSLLSDGNCPTSVTEYEAHDMADSSVANYSPLTLFKHPLLRRMALVLMFVWLINGWVYLGLLLTSRALVGNIYLNVFLNTVIEIPGGVLTYCGLKWIGRRYTCVIFNSIAALGLLISSVLQIASGAAGSSAITAFSVIGKFGNSIAFGSMFTFTPELFPTNMRSLGVGIAGTAARIGGMVAPYSILVIQSRPWLPGVLYSGTSFLCALLILILPETRDKPLPQTIQDVESWTKTNKNRAQI